MVERRNADLPEAEGPASIIGRTMLVLRESSAGSASLNKSARA
jgi:hypothetical protein